MPAATWFTLLEVMTRQAKPIIGLLGAPGSGKSYVASLFAEEGCGVIDADRLAKAALREPDVKQTLQQWWGDGVFDQTGEVDRVAVGAIVFGDPQQKKRLEDLIHPRVHAGRERMREQYLQAPDIVAIIEDTPLLLEAGLAKRMDKLVFIEVPFEVRLERVRERGWDAAELRRRENGQASLDTKRDAADDVMNNTGNRKETRDRVRQLLQQYLNDG